MKILILLISLLSFNTWAGCPNGFAPFYNPDGGNIDAGGTYDCRPRVDTTGASASGNLTRQQIDTLRQENQAADRARQRELMANEPGEIAAGKGSAAADACASAHKKTQVACNGIMISSSVMPILQQYQSSQSSGNVKEACEKAANLNKIGGVANLAFALTCQSAQKKCVSLCEEEKVTAGGFVPRYDVETYLADCEGKELIAQLSFLQVAMNASQFLGSKACANAASGKCVDAESIEDEDCAQFCSKPGRQTHPKCQVAANSCSDATYKANNAAFCGCIANPSPTTCGGLEIPTTTVTGLTNDSNPFDGIDELPGVDEFNGNAPIGNKTGVDQAGGGGSGFSGGGGGSSPFGQGDGQGGNNDEALNKDILGGQSSGGGSFGGGGGGGYESGGTAASKGGSKESDSLGFDLRAFLPGGKKDPKRGIASTGYSDQSITKANGDSNFLKVTRRMNQKKQELLP